MKEITNMSFADKQKIISDICLTYLKIKSNEEIFKRISNDKTKSIDSFNTISVFENILRLLNEEEKIVVKKDFMGEKDGPLWYLDFWCKTSYYKYKHNTVEKMMNLLFL